MGECLARAPGRLVSAACSVSRVGATCRHPRPTSETLFRLSVLRQHDRLFASSSRLPAEPKSGSKGSHAAVGGRLRPQRSRAEEGKPPEGLPA